MINFDFKNPDYTPHLKQRITRLRKIRSDPYALAAHKEVYKSDPIRFIEDWMTTYDPRVRFSTMPFVLWEKQKELINFIHENEADILVQKTRDWGVSYLFMAYSAWAWIFRPGTKIGIGSRKEMYVDRSGDPDSLFEKLRLLLASVPDEFLPVNYSSTFMKLINDDNRTIITGEAGDNIGRGGRTWLYILDEDAHMEHHDKIDAALSQNTNRRAYISTPLGQNAFWKKRMSGKIPVFICDWHDDPRKDQAWYDNQKILLDPWILAQEVDMDYTASVEGLCIPAKWVQAAVNFKLEPSGAKRAGLDVADDSGATGDANAICFRHGNVIEHIESWKNKTTTETARKAWADCMERGYDMLLYESVGVGAGVRGEMKSISEAIKKSEEKKTESKPALKVFPVNPGLTKLYGFYAPGKLNSDMFANLRAQLWWGGLRKRFEKTYQRANAIHDWPDDDCISIPNDHELIMELSQPKVFQNNAGKVQIESKKDMASRSIRSGNKADSLIISEYSPVVIYAV